MSIVAEQYPQIATELQSTWKKKNLLEVPRVVKISVNVGMGLAKEDKAYGDMVVQSLRQITGQQPIVTKARKSIASFKLREGMPVGAKVTLRGKRMEDFLTRVIHIVLPRVRDFRGVSPKGFDGRGNFTLGLTDHTVFPEISYDDVTRSHPLQITIVTTGTSDEEAREVLQRLQFPFIKDVKDTKEKK